MSLEKSKNVFLLLLLFVVVGNSICWAEVNRDFVPATISEITTEDSEGVCESIGEEVIISGVVHTINFNPPPEILPDMVGIDMTLIDNNNCGINLRLINGIVPFMPERGDSLTIGGIVQQMNGLTFLGIPIFFDTDPPMSVDPDMFILNSSNNDLVSPLNVTQALSEDTESRHIKIENLIYEGTTETVGDGSYDGYCHVHMYNSNANYIVRIENMTGMDVSTLQRTDVSYDITGVGSQRSSSSTALYLDGYMIVPSESSDIEIKTLTSLSNNIVSNDILLQAAYPNPFNPETTISFTLHQVENVDLIVFNAKGQKVKQLANGQFEKGQHSVIWKGTDNNDKPIASGIYFYKLSVNGKASVIRKCMLLK